MSTLLQLQVGASNDDAHEKDDATEFSASVGQVNMNSNSIGGGRYNGGFRFQNVTIAQGTNIFKAWLNLYIYGTDWDSPHLDMSAHDVDDAPDFTAPNDAVTTRLQSKTSAGVAWDDTDIGIGWRVGPHIAAVIQEIVNRGSWSSGNALVLLCAGKGSPNAGFIARSYDGESTQAAKLTIKHGSAVAVPHTLRHERARQNPTFPPFL